MVQKTSLPSFLQHVLELVVDALDMDFSVVLRDSENRMRVAARTGLDAWKGESVFVSGDQLGSLTQVITDGQSQFVDDWSGEGGGDGGVVFEPARSAGARTTAAVPLRDAQRVWGVMAFGTRYRHTFSEDEKRFLDEVASLVSEQLHRHQARDELRHSQHLIQVASRTLQLGGWSLDLPENRMHWSDEICEMLGYPPGEVPPLDEALRLYPEHLRP